MSKQLSDLVSRLQQRMAEWAGLIRDLRELRGRVDRGEGPAGPVEAFGELEAICLRYKCASDLLQPVRRVRGLGSKQPAEGPQYTVLLNRLFQYMDRVSPPPQEKPPGSLADPKPERTAPREGTR